MKDEKFNCLKSIHYVIQNRHGYVVYEGHHYSAYDAWKKMFEVCNYPENERVISEQINAGLEIIAIL